MKTRFVFTLLIAGSTLCGFSQSFTNLDFERARVVVNDPTFGFLDWSLAAPGWSHSSGSDASIVYYRSPHLGLGQYYLLWDSNSPVNAPGTQLAGRYSMSLVGGLDGGQPGSMFITAYLSQTGLIPSGTESVRLLAKGPFEVYVGGVLIPMQSLGGNSYGGDISTFAGTVSEFRFVSTAILNPVVVDNIEFSPVVVPEPSSIALVSLGSVLFFASKRRLRPNTLVEPTAGAASVRIVVDL